MYRKTKYLKDIQENTKENKQFDIWKDFDLQTPATTTTTPRSEAIVELEKYLNKSLLDRKSDPLMWWKEKKGFIPIYSRLCVPSTSVPSERILSMKNAETLLFLNSNV